MRDISDKGVEKIKTRVLCSVANVERGRPQMTMWRTRIACWIPKVTDIHTLRLCNTYCFSSHNNGCTNSSQRYVIRTLPVLLVCKKTRSLDMCTTALFFVLLLHSLSVTLSGTPSKPVLHSDIINDRKILVRNVYIGVSVWNRLRAGRPKNRSISGEDFFFFPKRTDRLWVPPSLLFDGCRWLLFLGLKRQIH